MEDALVHKEVGEIIANYLVLILVVMEDALVLCQIMATQKR